MRHLRFLPILLALALPALQAAPPATPAPAVAIAVPAAAANSTLRPGDSFEMRLTGVDPTVLAEIANIQYSIGSDGTVNIPLIGKMKAGGLSSTQLQDTIQNRYMADKIFTRPIVIITTQQVAPQRSISVSGGVRQAGRLPWSADMTLCSAITAAGDLDDFSSGKNIRIIRESQIFGTYNKKDLDKDPAKDPKLLPGDQVVVPKS